jgi:hypothetical protein
MAELSYQAALRKGAGVAKYSFAVRVENSRMEYLYESTAATLAAARREVQMISHLTNYRLLSADMLR